MSERYVVIRKSDNLIVNAILLDGPESETADLRYALCDGSAGIGWTVTEDGCVPPVVPEASAPTAEQLSAAIDALRAQLDAMAEVAP